jgi:hypothetical protein
MNPNCPLDLIERHLPLSLLISILFTTIEPEKLLDMEFGSNPQINRNNVDLPHPEEPTMETLEDGLT